MTFEQIPGNNEAEQHLDDIMWLPLQVTKVRSIVFKCYPRYVLEESSPSYDANLIVASMRVCDDVIKKTRRDNIVTMHELLGVAFQKASDNSKPPEASPGEINRTLKTTIVDIFDSEAEFALYTEHLEGLSISPNRNINPIWEVSDDIDLGYANIRTYLLNPRAGL